MLWLLGGVYALSELRLMVLMAVGLSSIVGAVLVNQTGDVEISGILTAVGGVSGISYFSLRGLSRGIPKFLSARVPLLASVAFMAAGGAVFSIGAIQNLLGNPASGLPLKIGGTVMLVAASLGFVLSLVTARTGNA